MAGLRLWVTGAFTMVSGGAMLAAGYALARSGWAIAFVLMLPAGLLITAALALVERQHTAVSTEPTPRHESALPTIRAVLITLVGVPWATGSRPLRLQLLISAGTL